MRRQLIVILLPALMMMLSRCGGPAEQGRIAERMTHSWKFYRGDTLHAELPAFDDNSWRSVDLPHDWSIEDLPGKNTPFDSLAPGGTGTGFLTGGTAWYRKSFAVPEEWKGRTVQIRFDGVYMNARVWCNGHLLGEHPYGYTAFSYDLTPYLLYGQENLLAVQVRNTGKNSRWYSGSGIYRPVELTVQKSLRFLLRGIFVTTPTVTDSLAVVRVQSKVVNGAVGDVEAAVTVRVLNPQGRLAARTDTLLQLAPGDTALLVQFLQISLPALWSPEAPHLYTALMTLQKRKGSGEKILFDNDTVRFGIRSIAFSAERGFLLNGRPLLLKGGCVHHDNGPLGAAAWPRAEERRVELLKANGFNAIRCAHNPPSQAFLEACDRLGMLVIDEAFDMWEKGKNPQDYHLYFDAWWRKDLESMVLSDRNHPCVILWSIGNEIPERATPRGAALAKEMRRLVRVLDTTRPVTAAVPLFSDIVPEVEEAVDPYFSALDVCGYNYGRAFYVPDHRRHPERIMVSTESFAEDAFGSWMAVIDHPWVLGDFVWTGMDYLGEASIGWLCDKTHYPWSHAYCGDLDICGWKRPQSFYRDALWKENSLALFVEPPVPSFESNACISSWCHWGWADVVADWNWKGHEEEPLTVVAYSSCEETVLFLNDKSLGRKRTDRSTRYLAEWMVPYRSGTLTAVGYEHGREVNRTVLSTAGKAAAVRLSADRRQLRADGEDLSYITVTVTDTAGILCPKADPLIRFSLKGPARIVAVGNGNPVSLESFRQPQRKAWRGRCLVIVQTERRAGMITLTATAGGLTPASITLTTK